MDVPELVTQVKLKTKFIRLRKLAALGDHIDGPGRWVGQSPRVLSRHRSAARAFDDLVTCIPDNSR
jgi:hypothetical protein